MPHVDLDDIEDVDYEDLSNKRLYDLEHGYSDFDDVLENARDPIALERYGGPPYSIIDGKHRVYIARQRGYRSVPARFV